jgi:hypothetical protein
MATETPQAAREIRLDLLSRYRNTRPFQADFEGRGDKVVFFGTWRPPQIIETKPPIRHKVLVDEATRPDLISFRVYGDVTLFWAIAMRNNLLLPLVELQEFQQDPRRVLLCPQMDDIQRALENSSASNSDA